MCRHTELIIPRESEEFYCEGHAIYLDRTMITRAVSGMKASVPNRPVLPFSISDVSFDRDYLRCVRFELT